jgi:hypothetical protein
MMREIDFSDDVDFSIQRERFAIDYSNLKILFEQMLQKTIFLENELRKCQPDLFVPDNSIEPPKKRSKL